MDDYTSQNEQGEGIFSKAVRAGKRTYFFDVRSTRNHDIYLTICESKRMFVAGSERPVFDKRKIHLYKEDFQKFADALNETLEYIKANHPEVFNSENWITNRGDQEGGNGRRFDENF